MTLLPIAALIQSQMKVLSLSRQDLVKRLGYKNIAKGLRNLDSVCEGEICRYFDLIKGLPASLELPDAAVAEALDRTRSTLKAMRKALDAQAEDDYRRSFKPHAVILTKRTVPSPIFMYALLGGDRIVRLDIDLSQPRDTWMDQAIAKLPAGIVCFGETTGLVFNYGPDEAVQYDAKTGAMTPLPTAKRIGIGTLRLSTSNKDLAEIFRQRLPKMPLDDV